MLLYLDASALVKLAIKEPDTEAVEAAVARCRAVFSSRLSIVECSRALARVANRRALSTMEEVFGALVLHDVNDKVLERAARLTPTTMRSLDAIHLATALLIDASDLAFLTYDDKLARAAKTHGLTILSA